jgi:hypothetical protein
MLSIAAATARQKPPCAPRCMVVMLCRSRGASPRARFLSPRAWARRDRERVGDGNRSGDRDRVADRDRVGVGDNNRDRLG